MLEKLLDGRYQVLQVLGEGGFSQTYVARDMRRPGYPKCVVKHLKPAAHNTGFLETARRLFISEAEILEQLGNHDQIPRLLAYFEENRELFLVQEFIEGHSLETELNSDRRWTEDQVIQLLQEVLGILEFVHRHNVIHRDINPSNIIRRQQDGKLVLIDFGAVKQIQTQMLTVPGQMQGTVVIGTQGYMPIEQKLGYPQLNSDIYSLGMIGIQALTGLHPSQIQLNSSTGESLGQYQAHVSSGLAAVLSKMVQYSFQKRYQSATDVLSALWQIGKKRHQSAPEILKAIRQIGKKLDQSASGILEALRQVDREHYNSAPQVPSALQPRDRSESAPEVPSALQPRDRQHSEKAPEVPSALQPRNNEIQDRSRQQANLSQPPQFSLFEQNTILALPTSDDPLGSILNPEQYNRLEEILVNLVGPVAPVLIRQVAASAVNGKTLIDYLALHLDSHQQIEFKQKTMFLLGEPTSKSLVETTSKTEIKLENLPDKDSQAINENFVRQCEQALTDLIGPIASFFVQKAVESSPQISRSELVNILAAELSDRPEKARQFQQRLLYQEGEGGRGKGKR